MMNYVENAMVIGAEAAWEAQFQPEVAHIDVCYEIWTDGEFIDDALTIAEIRRIIAEMTDDEIGNSEVRFYDMATSEYFERHDADYYI